MVVYVYSDESGVLDKVHNDYFVYGGVICVNEPSNSEWSRRYSAAEKVIAPHYEEGQELKATRITNKDKGKLYRSLNGCYKFGAIVTQKYVHDQIFSCRKSKQRYLDYVYKICVKRALEDLIQRNIINPQNTVELRFKVDEHTTATDGIYELRESLEQEFKIGTFNYSYNKFYPPIFPKLKKVTVDYCNSQSVLLVRASDIIANNIYYHTVSGEQNKLRNTEHMHITRFP